MQLQRLPNTDSFCLILPPNLKSAIAAITYMAEQLKKQDTDDTVRRSCATRHTPPGSLLLQSVWTQCSKHAPMMFTCHCIQTVHCWLSAYSMCVCVCVLPPDDRRLAVHRPGGGPSLPVVVCHHHHSGHPGNVLGCQFQLHTRWPFPIKDSTHAHTARGGTGHHWLLDSVGSPAQTFHKYLDTYSMSHEVEARAHAWNTTCMINRVHV